MYKMVLTALNSRFTIYSESSRQKGFINEVLENATLSSHFMNLSITARQQQMTLTGNNLWKTFKKVTNTINGQNKL